MPSLEHHPANKVKVLFICMGNICRSPSAEGAFLALVKQHQLEAFVDIASAGTHGYHIGGPADSRSVAAALERGIDLRKHKAQQLQDSHFEEYDYLLVMDETNYQHTLNRCPNHHQQKVKYFLQYAPDLERHDVPDPYYGGPDGFEHVLDLIEAASEGLLSEIKAAHNLN